MRANTAVNLRRSSSGSCSSGSGTFSSTRSPSWIPSMMSRLWASWAKASPGRVNKQVARVRLRSCEIWSLPVTRFIHISCFVSNSWTNFLISTVWRSRRRLSALCVGGQNSGLAQPAEGVDRLSVLANFEVDRRVFGASGAAGKGNGFTGPNPVAGCGEQAAAMAVQGHVAIAVIDNGHQPETSQPVGEDHAAIVYGGDFRVFCRVHDQAAAAQFAVSIGGAVVGDHAALGGPGQFVPQ